MTLDLSGCLDGELAALALAGRQSAYSALMQRHQGAVYRLVRAHVGDPDEALDVTQQSFVSAFAALRRYDLSRSFRVWISAIALNKCRDWARRRAVRRLFSLSMPLEAGEQVPDDAVPADRALGDAEQLKRALRAIGALPAPLKEPLILRTIENLSEAETAEALNITPKAVESRVYRARLRLAEMLKE